MPTFRFHDYELVTETRRLLHRGEDVAISLRVFEVVAYLVLHRERAIGRDELLSAVWGRVDGGDATLAQAVLKARRALGDDGSAQTLIRTVARFGYQWVAPTRECASLPTPVDAGEPGSDRIAAIDAPRPIVDAAAPQRQVARLAAPVAIVLAASVAVLAFALHTIRAPAPRADREPAAASKPAGVVLGLVLVTPTRVHSLSPDDGWMRLGVMALSAQALSGVPGHEVVPDENALAAVARTGGDASVEKLRAATGAAIVISSEATRIGEDWRIDATVLNADGSAELVSAKAGDAVTAAGTLARNLRDVLAPEGAHEGGDAASPAELSLAAHMKAAILEAQNGRALDLLAKAPKDVAAAPRVVLLEAEALTQIGRPADAIAALQPLADRAKTSRDAKPPRWMADAWTALGDAELARGRPGDAEAWFRRAIQLQDVADRRSLGLAWRGLGISQIVRNDLDGAEQSYLRARLELEPIGDRLLLARVTDGLGYIATTRGRLAEALMLYDQAATMGAAAGLNETELGSRLNAAQARQALLQHSRALSMLAALQPRIRALDYPALHQFGSVAYANALAETGQLDDARSALARLADARREGVFNDAVVDMRLDEAGVRLALGEPKAAAALAAAVLKDRSAAGAPDQKLEAAVTLLAAHDLAGDRAAAARVAADASLWSVERVRVPARVHALVARADFAAATGNAAGAIDGYRRAFDLARDFGEPLLLREAALPYAKFQLDAGAVDTARATASVLGPWAEDDFGIALLLARVAAATRQPELARSYFASAERLAGERWTRELAGEAEAAGVRPRMAAAGARSLAGG